VHVQKEEGLPALEGGLAKECNGHGACMRKQFPVNDAEVKVPEGQGLTLMFLEEEEAEQLEANDGARRRGGARRQRRTRTRDGVGVGAGAGAGKGKGHERSFERSLKGVMRLQEGMRLRDAKERRRGAFGGGGAGGVASAAVSGAGSWARGGWARVRTATTSETHPGTGLLERLRGGVVEEGNAGPGPAHGRR
jgi:hypothetical protein